MLSMVHAELTFDMMRNAWFIPDCISTNGALVSLRCWCSLSVRSPTAMRRGLGLETELETELGPELGPIWELASS